MLAHGCSHVCLCLISPIRLNCNTYTRSRLAIDVPLFEIEWVGSVAELDVSCHFKTVGKIVLVQF